MKIPFDLSLYLVTDSAHCGLEQLPALVEEAILGGVTLVQLREKERAGAELYRTALALREVTHRHHIPLLIDDRVDIALAVEADGVHLGSLDLPLEAGRRLIGPDKILGATAKTVEAALAAQQAGADYLGVGALFPTTTKVITVPTAISTLSAIRRAVDIPVVAIGGINLSNLSQLAGCGADGVAVVSAITASPSPREAAEQLRKLTSLLQQGWE